MLEAPWKIEMLGRLRLSQKGRAITRFRTYKTGALLAYLAYYPHRLHPREELIEMFWSEGDPAQGRNSLSQALSSLRHQLEAPGVPQGTALRADRFTVQLLPEALSSDVALFEAGLQNAARAEHPDQRIALLQTALERYGGELLPGYYEDWSLRERERLKERYVQALDALIAYAERNGDLTQAIAYARRALEADGAREETHAHLIRLYAASGQSSAALRQYRALTLTLEEIGAEPDPAIKAQIQRLGLAAPARERSAPPVAKPKPPPASAPPSEPRLAAQPIEQERRLPAALTRFFGRESELERVVQFLSPSEEGADSTRLLTLVGPGGIGKTRLSLEAARRLAPAFQEAVWFVPLAELTDATRLMDAIRDAMSLPPDGAQEARTQVIAALARQPALLVLDNFEQLLSPSEAQSLESVAPTRALLEQVADLRCLVTSRRRLGIAGEREIALAPLPLPEPSQVAPEQLAESPSVRLFVDRAQAVRPDFQITRGNATALAALCARLEGIPLALELAAARSQVLTPAQILQRLNRRLDLETDRRRQPTERHRTLRATIEWSYRLLTPELQRFFVQLSVFRGGWSYEAAEVVCDSPQALDDLAMLCECSLAQAEAGANEEIRFRLLETLQEYGEELRSEADAEALRRRHALYFLALAEEAIPHFTDEAQAFWLQRLEAEHDNLRAALDWAEREASADICLRLSGALWRFWDKRGYLREGRERLERALAHPDASSHPAAQALAYNGAGVLAMRQGEYERAKERLEASRALAERLQDTALQARCLGNLGTIAYYQGDYALAETTTHRTLELYRQLGDTLGVARGLLRLGMIRNEFGDGEGAFPYWEEALVLTQQCGDPALEANIFISLGNACVRQKNVEAGRVYLEQALERYQRLEDRWHIALALGNLGELALKQSRHADAWRYYTESLALQREIVDREGIAYSLEGLAATSAHLQRPFEAGRLLGAAERLREENQLTRLPSYLPQYEACVAAVQAALSPSEFEASRRQGRTLTLAQAMELPFARNVLADNA